MKEETITIKRKKFSEKCPKCPLVIEGTSEGQVKYNLGVHIGRKHKVVDNETQGGAK